MVFYSALPVSFLVIWPRLMYGPGPFLIWKNFLNQICSRTILAPEPYQWHSHQGVKRQSALPWLQKNCQKSGKKREKIMKKREKEEKVRKVLSLCPSWQIGLATPLFEMHTAPGACLLFAPGAVCFSYMVLEHLNLDYYVLDHKLRPNC